jgi:hypothetical protein
MTPRSTARQSTTEMSLRTAHRYRWQLISLAALHRNEDGSRVGVVDAGDWGCSSLGGNAGIKAMCMMIAAGLADVKVELTMTANGLEEGPTFESC